MASSSIDFSSIQGEIMDNSQLPKAASSGDLFTVKKFTSKENINSIPDVLFEESVAKAAINGHKEVLVELLKNSEVIDRNPQMLGKVEVYAHQFRDSEFRKQNGVELSSENKKESKQISREMKGIVRKAMDEFKKRTKHAKSSILHS